MKALLLLLVAGAVLASPIMVGPIGLTGTGTLSSPDNTPYGAEGLGGTVLQLYASGSADGHTVSINTGLPIPEPFSVNPQGPFSSLFGCTFTIMNLDFCGISIDGITGYGQFSNIGGGSGLLEVWSAGYVTLLAEAQVFSSIQIVDLTYSPDPRFVCPSCPGGSGTFLSTFNIVSTPEPGTWIVGAVLLCWPVIRRYQTRNRIRRPTSALVSSAPSA